MCLELGKWWSKRWTQFLSANEPSDNEETIKTGKSSSTTGKDVFSPYSRPFNLYNCQTPYGFWYSNFMKERTKRNR